MNEERNTDRLWIPFTNMKEFHRSPLILKSGDGQYVSDVDGNRYIDCISSLWHAGVGHSNSHYMDRISEQLRSGMTSSSLFGVMHEVAVELSGRLVDFVGHSDLSKVFLASGGSEAVETALKLAIQYNRIRGRKGRKIAYLKRAYHGVSLGALSAMGLEKAREGYEDYLSNNFVPIQNPYCYRCPCANSFPGCSLKCADEFESAIVESGNEITALIVEPVQGAGGIVVPPPGYLKRMVDICRKYDIVVVLDEVVTGMWRTGYKFAFEEEGCVPDILILSKGISGGYAPLGAVVVSQKIYDAFDERGNMFCHGNTYAGSPLACAAGIAHLDYVSRDDFRRNLSKSMEVFYTCLESLREFRKVGDVRYKGMMAGVELVKDVVSKEPLVPYEPLASIGRRHGLLLRPLDNVVTLFPMLNCSEETLKEMFESLRGVFRELDGEV